MGPRPPCGATLGPMDMGSRFADKLHRARLRLRPPAAEAEVAAFEAAAGVGLPADYREFLLSIANGGDEPCRLLPLARWWSSHWNDHPQPAMVGQPCVITPEAEALGEAWLDHVGVPDWSARWDRNEWDPLFGSIAVAEIGCGLHHSLIVTGPYRGRLFCWGDHAARPPHLWPEANFADWFEACLDDLLAGRAVHFLDGRLPG